MASILASYLKDGKFSLKNVLATSVTVLCSLLVTTLSINDYELSHLLAIILTLILLIMLYWIHMILMKKFNFVDHVSSPTANTGVKNG